MSLRRILEAPVWQMTAGERFALEGVLAAVKPSVAVLVRTSQGGMARVAEHSREVHVVDALPEAGGLSEDYPSVRIHVGDSRSTLPTVLEQLGNEGKTVDFALVDGDHLPEAVASDARALLDSETCTTTVMVFHAASNEDVRAALDSLDFDQHPKVAAALLDFVPGRLLSDPASPNDRMQIWHGLALVLLGGERIAMTGTRAVDSSVVLRLAREHAVSDPAEAAAVQSLQAAERRRLAELAERERSVASIEAVMREKALLAEELIRAESALSSLPRLTTRLARVTRERDDWRALARLYEESLTWRVTQPLRDAKQHLLAQARRALRG